MDAQKTWATLMARIQELERELRKARSGERNQKARAEAWKHRALNPRRPKR